MHPEPALSQGAPWPFGDLTDRATESSARIALLRRSRRRNLPKLGSATERLRIRPTSPLAADAELVEVTPALVIEWPPTVKEAQRRIDESQWMRLHNDSAALARTYEAFLAADLDLAKDLNQFADPRSAVLHHPRRHEDLARALQQLSGHVQRYVSAARALVDHARRFRKQYAPPNTPEGNEYDVRVASAFGGPETTLVELLRNYSMHYALPMIVAQPGQVATPHGWPTEILVDTASLLRLDCSAAEKTLLNRWPEGVAMVDLVVMYSARVVAFYAWLGRRLDRWYRPARSEYVGLTRELDEAFEGAGLSGIPTLIERLQRGRD